MNARRCRTKPNLPWQYAQWFFIAFSPNRAGYRPVQDEHHAIAVYCNAPLVLQPNIANWTSAEASVDDPLAGDEKGRHAHLFASGPNIATEAFVRLIAPGYRHG